MLKIKNIYHTQGKIEEYLEKIIKEHEIDIIINITKKGYWVSELVDCKSGREISRLLKEKKIRKISDRYLMKCLNFKEFEGKRILIFDDTMNNGSLLFFYYALLKEKGAKEVIPCVYALNTHYDPQSPEIIKSRRWGYERTIRRKMQDEKQVLSEREVDLGFQRCRKEFDEKLTCCIWMSPAEIGRLSVTETLWFQKNVMPMVVDLPIYSRRKDPLSEGKDHERLTISEEEWEQLKQGNSIWKKEECQMELAGETLYYGYFQYLNETFYSKFENLMFNFIVRYKYEPVEDGKIQIVFVPFAILNSCKLKNLVWNFFYLFKNTEYAGNVAEELNRKAGKKIADASGYKEENKGDVLDALKKNHNMCRALYRAMIFDISNYIGILFQKYVEEKIQLKIECNWQIMKENLEESLIRSLKEKYESKQKEDYLSVLMGLHMSEKIAPRMESMEEAAVKRKATEENLELLLTQIVTERKQKAEAATAQVMITLESLCSEVQKQFVFEDKLEFRKRSTDLLLVMTENSRLGNEIYVDDKAEILYRGFRAGENCEVLMRWGIQWFYPYILAFYEKVGIEKYAEQYDAFMEKVELEFRKQGYIGTVISEAAFLFYKKYFSNKEMNTTQILNKEYLLDELDKQKNNKMDDYCNTVFHTVMDWDM